MVESMVLPDSIRDSISDFVLAAFAILALASDFISVFIAVADLASDLISVFIAVAAVVFRFVLKLANKVNGL